VWFTTFAVASAALAVLLIRSLTGAGVAIPAVSGGGPGGIAASEADDPVE
jgi:hypothetical protein